MNFEVSSYYLERKKASVSEQEHETFAERDRPMHDTVWVRERACVRVCVLVSV